MIRNSVSSDHTCGGWLKCFPTFDIILFISKKYFSVDDIFFVRLIIRYQLHFDLLITVSRGNCNNLSVGISLAYRFEDVFVWGSMSIDDL